jgi:hypothetical protein
LQPVHIISGDLLQGQQAPPKQQKKHDYQQKIQADSAIIFEGNVMMEFS